MMKRLVYLLIFLAAPLLIRASANKIAVQQTGPGVNNFFSPGIRRADTIKLFKMSAKDDAKIKDVPKAKRQPKPEKVEDAADAKKAPAGRQKRPEGLQRPPEIPRRNDN